jgi:signal transduction histidine kinase
MTAVPHPSRILPRKLAEHLPRLEREQLEHYLQRALDSDQLLRCILETITEGVLAMNNQHVVLFANAAARDLIGVAEPGLSGRVLDECIRDPQLRDAVRGADARVHATRDVQVTYPRRLSLSLSVVPFAPDAETPASRAPAYLLLLRDVSSEHDLRAAREREARLEALRLLTAGVAHEIGNPLSAIIMHSQLMGRALAKRTQTPAMAELARTNAIVHEESVRLKRIVRDFLEAVRPVGLDARPGNVADVLEDTFELLYTELAERKVALLKHLQPVPNTVFDAAQLRGAIINIVRNALDAMPDGGTLEVTLMHRGDWLELRFKDDGAGIPAEVLPRLFTPFYTTKPHGSGLGLFIVQRVVHAMGGSVRVHSAAGHGAEIVLELPVRTHMVTKSLPSPPLVQSHAEDDSDH